KTAERVANKLWIERGKNRSDRTLYCDLSEVVERSRLAIDDRERCAGSFRDERQCRRRLNLQRRSDDEEEVRLRGSFVRTLHRRLGDALAKGDDRRLDQSAALTTRRCSGRIDHRANSRERHGRAAVEAAPLSRVAVDLDEP